MVAVMVAGDVAADGEAAVLVLVESKTLRNGLVSACVVVVGCVVERAAGRDAVKL